MPWEEKRERKKKFPAIARYGANWKCTYHMQHVFKKLDNYGDHNNKREFT